MCVSDVGVMCVCVSHFDFLKTANGALSFEEFGLLPWELTGEMFFLLKFLFLGVTGFFFDCDPFWDVVCTLDFFPKKETFLTVLFTITREDRTEMLELSRAGWGCGGGGVVFDIERSFVTLGEGGADGRMGESFSFR